VLAAALTWATIQGNGGLQLGATTTVEVVADLVCGLVAAVGVLVLSSTGRNTAGAVAAGVFGLFVVFSAVSTVWSVAPDQSWLEANRLVSYLAVFAIGVVLVQLSPQRWTALLGGITGACLLVSGWALLHKAFPGSLDADEVYARLREPFGYWNAVGLMAALGVPGCLWLGARRAGHAAVNALAYPATGLLIVVTMLSYSRGALLALVLGCAFWFSVVPLRLRGFAVLATGAIGGGLVIAWVFSQDALSEDKVPLSLRDQAGHQLLIAVVFMLLVLLGAGLAITFFTQRRSLRPVFRRRAGLAVLAALSLIPIGGAVALSTTDRGLGGSISHGWTQLTDPNASQPSNEPGRLTAVGSVRARYWNDGLKIFKDHAWLGVGAGGYQTARLRYRTDTLDVLHAHGYVVQVLADRGLVGLLLSLAALIALGIAIARATRRTPTTPERVGLLTLTAMIVVFGVHSFVDWTWFIPGVAFPVLLAGGWLAGRGRPAAPPPGVPGLWAQLRAAFQSRARVFAAVGAVALALAAAFAAAQPQRAVSASDDALDSLGAGKIGTARRQAHNAQQRNPLSTQPLFIQSAIELKAGNRSGAQHALEEAVRLQPADPGTWTALAAFQLHTLKDAAAAKHSLSAALYLDPRNLAAVQLLLEANRS
jgi:hypothetical protein